jgi:hypothetical protein
LLKNDFAFTKSEKDMVCKSTVKQIKLITLNMEEETLGLILTADWEVVTRPNLDSYSVIGVNHSICEETTGDLLKCSNIKNICNLPKRSVY